MAHLDVWKHSHWRGEMSENWYMAWDPNIKLMWLKIGWILHMYDIFGCAKNHPNPMHGRCSPMGAYENISLHRAHFILILELLCQNYWIQYMWPQLMAKYQGCSCLVAWAINFDIFSTHNSTPHPLATGIIGFHEYCFPTVTHSLYLHDPTCGSALA